MTCPAEFTLAQYVDGELPENEARELSEHLDVCAACREQVTALRIETQALAQSLQGIDLWEPEQELAPLKAPARVRITRPAAVFVGAAILLRMGYGLVMDLKLPLGLDWLYPLSLSGLSNWLLNGLFYIIGEGGSIMASLVNGVGLALLGILILGCLIAMTRRVIGTAVIVGIMALMIVSVLPGYALDIRGEKGGGSITIAPGETIEDSLVAFGDSVNVRGTVTGDLIAFARKINIQGTVQGNVIGFAQGINVTGNVEGDLFGFAQSFQENGRVGRSLWGFAHTLAVDTGSKLEHDATLFGVNQSVDGEVGRDLTSFGAFLDVGGVIGRDVRFRGDRLAIHSPSRIGRDLQARVKAEKDVQIDSGATIAGRKKIELRTQVSKYLTPGFYGKQVLRIGAAFLMGLLLFWLVPSVGNISLSTGKLVFTSGGIGFLVAVATPVAAIILAITLIGLPIALVSVVLLLLGLYLAKIIVARFIGGAVLGAKENGMKATAMALLVGLIIIIVAVNLPYIGGVLNILLILVGLGALVTTVYHQVSGLRHRPSDAS